MLVTRRTDDRVDRAGADAFGAADAVDGPDPGNPARGRLTAFGVGWEHGHAEQACQVGNGRAAAGRAAIDRGLAEVQRLGIGTAAVEAAAAALRLRQLRVDAVDVRMTCDGGSGRAGQAERLEWLER